MAKISSEFQLCAAAAQFVAPTLTPQTAAWEMSEAPENWVKLNTCSGRKYEKCAMNNNVQLRLSHSPLYLSKTFALEFSISTSPEKKNVYSWDSSHGDINLINVMKWTWIGWMIWLCTECFLSLNAHAQASDWYQSPKEKKHRRKS